MRYRVLVSVCLAMLVMTTVVWYFRRKRQKETCTLRGIVRLVTTASDVERRREATLHRLLEKCPHSEDGLLSMATFYKRGVYGLWSPNPPVADALCRHLVLYGKDCDVKTDAMSLLYEQAPDSVDCRGPVIPPGHADRMISSVIIPPYPIPSRQRFEQRHVSLPPSPKIQKKPVVRSDPQNSHQHSVVTSSRNALCAIPPVDDTDILKAVESYIASDCDPLIQDETKAKALHALDSITSFESPQFNGLSEKQALARVWSTPHHRDILVQQLASSIEDGLPVCHTGKMTRFASTLDNGQSVIPMHVVKSSLLQKAASIRDAYLSSGSVSEREDYHQNDDSILRDKMVNAFVEDAKVYIQESGFDSGVMHPVIDDITENGF